MNSNQSLKGWETLGIRAIKERNLWLFCDVICLMQSYFGNKTKRKYLKKIAKRREPRLSINDFFWLDLNAFLYDRF